MGEKRFPPRSGAVSMAVASGSCVWQSLRPPAGKYMGISRGRGTNRITIQSCNKECDVTASRQYYAVDQTSRNEDV